MMRILGAILLATVSAIPIAHAEQVKHADPQQIRTVAYSATKRVEIVGVVGQPTNITFPQGEHVYRVVQSQKINKDGTLGDAPWQNPTADEVKDAPLGNNLPLWPATAGESYMTVITETTFGVQRPYAFHLVAKPAGDLVTDGDVTLNLIFKGGVAPGAAAPTTDDPPTVRPRLARYRRDPNELENAETRLRTDSFNPADNQCHYVAHGVHPSAITPLCPLSNGVWTLMRFPGFSKKPAVYIVGADGAERLARQHESGDFVVVEEIAQHFRLRLSPDVLDILNTGYNPVGNPSGSGTIAPTVQRQILQARAP